MNIIKKFRKSEKGSITVMVLSAMLFLIGVITVSYFAMSNKSIDQNKKVSQIAKQYKASDEKMEKEYQKAVNNVSLTIEQAQSKGMFEKKSNTELVDDYGNKIVIPAGFKVTNDAKNVTEGIVIEDENGNQFVWIPVGEIYTDVENTQLGKKTIKLGRYQFAEDGTETEYTGDYIEETFKEHDSNYGNVIAKDIENFKISSINNNGYYIGRYEARKNSEGNISEVGTDTVYNNVSQADAAKIARNMYDETLEFTSDLVNSYAWDTAIVFLQRFDNRTNKKIGTYSRQDSLNTDNIAIQGTNNLKDIEKQDKICNVCDMSSNCLEWSTETYKSVEAPFVVRGGVFNDNNLYTSGRVNTNGNSITSCMSFRPILYLK